MVARVVLAAERVEHEAVGTQPLLGDAVVAVVVLVTLDGVLVVAVTSVGARKLLS